jgi:predicted O-methyltransferase YrrM
MTVDSPGGASVSGRPDAPSTDADANVSTPVAERTAPGDVSAWRARVQAAVESPTRYPDIDAVYPTPTSSWPVHLDMARVLAHLVIEFDRRAVVEFGAGTSSLVLAAALARGAGGRLTAVEEDIRWSRASWQRVKATSRVDARIIESRVVFRADRAGVYHGYSRAAKAAAVARGPFDLALIDAPDGFFGRDGALHLIYEALAPGALVVVDDSRRRKERDMMARWLRTYPGLVLLADEPDLGHGTAVLGFTGDRRVRLSPRALASGAVREAYAWVRNLAYTPPVPPSDSP